MTTLIDKKSIKRFFNKNPVLLKTAKSIRFYIRKIFIGYQSYPDIPGRIQFNDQSLIKKTVSIIRAWGDLQSNLSNLPSINQEGPLKKTKIFWIFSVDTEEF